MSAFFEFLARYMLNTSVQLALFVIFVALLAFLGRRFSARFRYALWTLVLLKAILPPFFAVPWSMTNQVVEPVMHFFAVQTADSDKLPKSAEPLPAASIATSTVISNAVSTVPADNLSVLPEMSLPPGMSPDEQNGTARTDFDAHNAQVSTAGTNIAPNSTSNNISLNVMSNVMLGTRHFPYLLGIWLTGTVVFWGLVFYYYGWAMGLLAKGKRLENGPIHALLATLAARLHLQKVPQIVLSESVRSPFLWGLWNPQIAIPAGFPGDVGPDEMESVLLHELMHWKRGDLFVARLELLVRSVFWFHPFVWLANVQLRKERESACDEAVLASGCVSAKRYGDSLLNVMLTTCEPSPMPVGFLGFLGILERKSQLKQRLEEIMSQQQRVKRIGIVGWCVLSFFALCVLPMAVAQQEAAKSEEKAKETQTSETKEQNAPTIWNITEKDGKFVLKNGKTELVAEPLPATPDYVKDKSRYDTFSYEYRQKTKLGGAVHKIPQEEYFRLSPKFATTFPDGGLLVTKVVRLSPFDKLGVHPDDVIIGLHHWKMSNLSDLGYFLKQWDTLAEKNESLKVWLLRGDNCYFLDVPTKRQSDQKDDGGFAGVNGFTHIVAIGGKGDFVPKSKTRFSRAISEAFADSGITFGVVRSRVENGKLICLELTNDPEGFKEVLDASPDLEHLRTERLTTKAAYDEYFKNYDNSHFLPPEDGGFVWHGHKYLVTFEPKGNFVPKTSKELFEEINNNAPWAFAGHYKTRVEDNKLVGMFFTDDAEEMKRVIESTDKLEFVGAERLTKKLYDNYQQTPSSFLPNVHFLKIATSDWYKLLNQSQKNYVAWDENQFAYVYDPKNYEVGDDRDEFEAKWVAQLEGEEPGYPGSELVPYDKAIFGLATIKSDKATKLLVKIAAERVLKDNAHRHYATKALGMLGDPAAIPELIPLLYHFNMNTRWDAQISLVRLTGQNFDRDADAWGKWYNENREKLGKDLPEFDLAPVDWSCGSVNELIKSHCTPEKQKEVDRQFGK